MYNTNVQAGLTHLGHLHKKGDEMIGLITFSY